MPLYPHLELEENRRELEREQELRRKIRQARREARSLRSSPLSRLSQALRQAAGLRPEPRQPERTMHASTVECHKG
jgi:hypothetical protein